MKKLIGVRGILTFIVVLWVALAASYGWRGAVATDSTTLITCSSSNGPGE